MHCVSVEPNTHSLGNFVRRCIILMNCLPRLCALHVISSEWTIVLAIPQVMDARANLPLHRVLYRIVGEGIPGIHTYGIVAGIQHPRRTVLACRNNNVDRSAVEEHSATEILGVPHD